MKNIIITAALMTPLFAANALAENTTLAMDEQIQTIPCNHGRNIAQSLDDTIKPPYVRDLGWRQFSDDNGRTVERAVVVNKLMEIRYRWRADKNGNFQAMNERTQALCMS